MPIGTAVTKGGGKVENKCWQGCGGIGTLLVLIEGSNGATTVGHRLVPLKSKHWITIRCASFMSRRILKKIEREMQIHSHSTTFMALFTEAKRWAAVHMSLNRVTDKQNVSLHGMIRL